jgi:hypothetical protein
LILLFIAIICWPQKHCTWEVSLAQKNKNCVFSLISRH